jgi:hypothetical protein
LRVSSFERYSTLRTQARGLCYYALGYVRASTWNRCGGRLRCAAQAECLRYAWLLALYRSPFGEICAKKDKKQVYNGAVRYMIIDH